jgi:transposase
MKLVCPTIDDLQLDRPAPTEHNPQGLCLDKGYDYDQVRQWVEQFGFTAHIRSRSDEAKAISTEAGFRARRWVVERTHSWMNRFRGLLIRWPKKASNYLALLHLVCGIIAWRAAGLLG